MWLVRLALRRPYTFVVAALLLVILTPFVLLRTPTDIFPAINIPVVSVIWSYTGLDAQQMERRIVYLHERVLTVTVNNIEHIESTSYNGIGVIKVFLQPKASVDSAVAQITAVSQTVLKQMPPGMTPPLIIQYNASTVPILQYSISSPKMSEQELYDVTLNRIRVGLISVPGAMMPVALWRQEPHRRGGLEPARAQGEKPAGGGCHQRHQRPKPRSAQRHGQNRRDRIRHCGGFQRAAD